MKLSWINLLAKLKKKQYFELRSWKSREIDPIREKFGVWRFGTKGSSFFYEGFIELFQSIGVTIVGFDLLRGEKRKNVPSIRDVQSLFKILVRANNAQYNYTGKVYFQ